MLNAPRKYHSANNLQVEVSGKLLEKAKPYLLKKNLSNVESIDIGTGDGRVLHEVLIKSSGIQFAKVVGSDRRKEVIEFAQETYGNDMTSFEVLDIEHATEVDIQNISRSGSFDFATSSFCLHYVLDFEKTFMNINKLLKFGGSFYFNFLATYNLVDVHLKLAEKYPQIKNAIYDQLPPLEKNNNFKDDLREILLKCGFEINFLTFENLDYDFVTEQRFRDTHSTSIPFLYGLEKNVFDNFMTDYVEIFKSLYGSSEKGSFVITLTALHGLITKKGNIINMIDESDRKEEVKSL